MKHRRMNYHKERKKILDNFVALFLSESRESFLISMSRKHIRLNSVLTTSVTELMALRILTF